MSPLLLYPRLAVAHTCYWLGDLCSHLVHAVCYDWPRAPEWLFTACYRPYNTLMTWSARLDVGESVWMKRQEGESEEAFEARRVARWPT